MQILSRFLGFLSIAATALVIGATAVNADEMSSHGWEVQNYNIKGTWSIVTEGDTSYVVLSDDFRTRNAPDLKIFFSPLAASDLTDDNATEGSILVSQLESNKGGQRYAIPEGVDLSTFNSIIIHCERFSKLWGSSSLPNTDA